MPLSTDISLPRSHTPIFPDRCVACGFPQPDHFIRVGTNTIGWWTIALWIPGTRYSRLSSGLRKLSAADEPAAVGQNGWFRIFVVVGVAVAAYLLGSLRGPLKRWLALGIALLCMVPWFAWELVYPRPVDLTAYSSTVTFEFRDEDYADDFASLNQ